MQDEGYEVVLASGGAEAIAAFEKKPADCVLLDVRMPDIDGFAVCERIRALPQGAETPVLFLTALRDVDNLRPRHPRRRRRLSHEASAPRGAGRARPERGSSCAA